jgi:hypothetical protein
MKEDTMTRPVRVVALALGALVALVGITGCGRLREEPAGDATESTELSWDEQALASVGFVVADLTTPAADEGASADGQRHRPRHPRLRFLFRNTLHGEATVQTEEGVRTVVVQRGTVTDVSSTALTVRSSDGFTLTWVLGERTTVVVDRARSEIANVPVGTEVGVAGSRDGETVTARLVVVPRR